MIWRCPVCQESLQLGEREAACTQNHHFDRAKQGYYNLLLSNQKQSELPGDNLEMISARNAFHTNGYYAPLAELLASNFQAAAERLERPVNFLDCGCGDGYYTQKVAQSLVSVHSENTAAGIDISKHALKFAARQYKDIPFTVSSNFLLPIADKAVDLALVVFAPFDHAELSRVMADDGELIVVAPGPMHLWELRCRLYRKPKPHEAPAFVEGFARLEEERLRFSFQMDDQASVQNLLTMTPYGYQASAGARKAYNSLLKLEVGADFLVSRYKKRD